MGKILLVVALLSIAMVSPVIAKQDKNPKADEHSTGANNPDPQPTCDPSNDWKNHGAYVSCVAHTRPGGQVVSDAAQSDVGKKSQEVSPTSSVSPTTLPTTSPTSSISPSVSPSLTPTVSSTSSLEPSVSPKVSPEVTSSPSNNSAGNQTSQAARSVRSQVQALIEVLKSILSTLLGI